MKSYCLNFISDSETNWVFWGSYLTTYIFSALPSLSVNGWSNNVDLLRFWGLNEVIYLRDLVQCLKHSTCSKNVRYCYHYYHYSYCYYYYCIIITFYKLKDPLESFFGLEIQKSSLGHVGCGGETMLTK